MSAKERAAKTPVVEVAKVARKIAAGEKALAEASTETRKVQGEKWQVAGKASAKAEKQALARTFAESNSKWRASHRK